MSSNSRYFNTKFWRDNYVDSLVKDEKLGFIYLFTNPEATKCGIYELLYRTMEGDTGLSKKEIEALFIKFTEDKKAFYVDGWVCTTSTIKHQATSNIKIRKGIENDLDNVPEDILKSFYESGDKRFKKIIDDFHYKKNNEYVEEVKTVPEKVNVSEPIVPEEKKEVLKTDPIEPKKPKVKKLRNVIPPTLEMVQKYKAKRIAEKVEGAKKINPQGFIDHYDANGWVRGKTKIKDWCACFRTWEGNQNNFNTNSTKSSGDYNPRPQDALKRQKKEEEYRDELRRRNQTSVDNERMKKLQDQARQLANDKTI